MEIKGKAAYITMGVIAVLLFGGLTFAIYGRALYEPLLGSQSEPETKQATASTCVTAGGSIWTNVQLYQDAACATPTAIVLGGQKGKVKIRYGSNAEGEWKTRSVVANQMYVRKNDPAIAVARWVEVP